MKTVAVKNGVRVFSILVLLLALAIPALAEGPVHWGYEGEEGPEHWGDLSPDFSLCSTGTEQSPIDVPSSATLNPADLSFNYQPSAVNILNNGHTVQVNYDAGSAVEIDGQSYNLLQFHFHAGSENTIDGTQTPLEVHLVHQNADGGLAVIGAWLVEGSENEAYAPVFSNLPAEEREATPVEGATVDASALIPADASYYRFNGSLTTPPCSEGVKWHMMSNPVELSTEQIAAFTAIYDNNFRPVQPLNDRSFLLASEVTVSPESLPETGSTQPIAWPLVLLIVGGTVSLAGLYIRRLNAEKA